jgi:hypothetical protein
MVTKMGVVRGAEIYQTSILLILLMDIAFVKMALNILLV